MKMIIHTEYQIQAEVPSTDQLKGELNSFQIKFLHKNSMEQFMFTIVCKYTDS